MHTRLGAKLLNAIKSDKLEIAVVYQKSPMKQRSRRCYEMILITEGEIFAWIECWKQNTGATDPSGLPRICVNDSTVYVIPGEGRQAGFTLEMETPLEAVDFAELLRRAFHDALVRVTWSTT